MQNNPKKNVHHAEDKKTKTMKMDFPRLEKEQKEQKEVAKDRWNASNAEVLDTQSAFARQQTQTTR